MSRISGHDIQESYEFFILIDFIAGDFSFDYFTEDAVVHIIYDEEKVYKLFSSNFSVTFINNPFKTPLIPPKYIQYMNLTNEEK